MPMPRSLPRLWLSRRRALKPFQSAFSIAASMIFDELARIEHELGRRRIGNGFLGDEIAAPDLVRRHVQLTRGRIDEALDQIRRFRPAGAAIGAHRHGVGANALHVDGDRRRRVEAGDEIGRACGNERPHRREIGAEVCDQRNAQPEELALRIHRKFGAREVIAPLIIRNETLRAIGLPAYRPLELLGRPHHEHLLGIDERLHAEAAADVRRRDDAQFFLRDLQHHLGERIAHEMRALRAGVEHGPSGGRVPIADRVARLHRVRHDAIVDHLQRGDMRRLGEGRIGRGEIRGVVVPVENQVAGNSVEQLRRAFLQRGARVGHGGQGFVVDLDRLRGVLRLCQRLGDHEHDRLAEVAHFADRQRGARRIVARRAVLVVERGMAGNIAEPVGLHVLAGQHQQYAGHLARGRRVDAADVGVRDARAHHIGLRRLVEMDVVGIAARAGNQGLVFETPNGLANAEFHGDSVKIGCSALIAVRHPGQDGVWNRLRIGRW